MAYKTGKSKSLEDITLKDVLKNPIWEWASDEEGDEDQDETWQRPILNTDNVTDEMFNPTITLKIKGEEIYGSGELDLETDTIRSISLWLDNEWKILGDYKGQVPIIFVSVARINGAKDVEFICNNVELDVANKV